MKFRFAALSLALASSTALAAVQPLNLSTQFDLSKSHPSQPFLVLMSEKPNGIKAALDADYPVEFKITSAKDFRSAAKGFEGLPRMEAQIEGGAKALDQFVGTLSGKSTVVDKLWGVVNSGVSKGGLSTKDKRFAGSFAPLLALASGRGVLVQLDEDTYVYNVGYAHGSEGLITGKTEDEKSKQKTENATRDKEDRRTGRSYGASRTRNADDPSDNDFLRELAKYATDAREAELEQFYTTVFQILLKSDTSGIKNLSPEGQTVLADYMAIYMAELDRHLMTGLQAYEWENALTEITMLAAYSTHPDGKTLDISGGVKSTGNRDIVLSGSIKNPGDRLLGFFGVGTDGSGLDGANKARRHVLTSQISKAQGQTPEAKRLSTLINARPGSDVYDHLMNYINNFKTQDQIQSNADEMIDLVVKFVMNTRAAAPNLKEVVQ